MPNDNDNPWRVVSVSTPQPDASGAPDASKAAAPQTQSPSQSAAQTNPEDPWKVMSVSPAGNPPVQPASGEPTISTIHEPTTYLGKLGRWAENVSNDLKYGTDRTGVGHVLQKMGAHGVYMGNPEAVGDFMASLPLGLLKAGKGIPELAPSVIGGEKGKTWQGLKDIVGGGLQAAEMPSAFVAPEAGEVAAEKAGSLTSTAGRVAGRVVSPIVSKAEALVTDIPKETEEKLVSALGDLTEKEGFERSGTADTIVDATKHLMTSFQQRAKTAYDALDKAASGFQELRDTITNQERAVKAQSALDPGKAKGIAEELAANKDKMAKLLTDEQKAAWKAANEDYARFKALERFFVKAKGAAGDLTSSELTDVPKLKAGMKALGNVSRQGTSTDMLSRAFGEGTNTLKAIVQKGSDMTIDKEVAKKLLRWIVPSLGLAGAGYEGLKHLIPE